LELGTPSLFFAISLCFYFYFYFYFYVYFFLKKIHTHLITALGGSFGTPPTPSLSSRASLIVTRTPDCPFFFGRKKGKKKKMGKMTKISICRTRVRCCLWNNFFFNTSG
jgi:hypothetical protein